MVALPSIYGVTVNLSVPASLSISMVKLYWDANCTNEVTSVAFGSIIPGTTVNQTIFVKNFGGEPVNLVYTAVNYTPPEASLYVTFSCDQSGQNVSAHFVQQATIFCSVDPSITNTTISTVTFNIQLTEEW